MSAKILGSILGVLKHIDGELLTLLLRVIVQKRGYEIYPKHEHKISL